MAITIKRVKNERGVKLGSLKVGDTFLYDNRVGVIACHCGNMFPMDLTTCQDMSEHNAYSFTKMLPPDQVVLPVEVEMTYKVMG